MGLKVNEPIFRTYCGCGDLKKTAEQAGYINVGIGVIAISAALVSAACVGYFNYDCEDKVDCVPKFLHFQYLLFYGALFSYGIFTLFSGLVYIDGIKNNDPSKMVLLLVSRIFATAFAIAIPLVFEIFHIIFSTLPIILEVYTLLCLFSYYIILKNEECKTIA